MAGQQIHLIRIEAADGITGFQWSCADAGHPDPTVVDAA
jgi:hypothetical protein